VFLLGSLLCAGAWNIVSLIVFRVVQAWAAAPSRAPCRPSRDLYGLRERGVSRPRFRRCGPPRRSPGRCSRVPGRVRELAVDLPGQPAIGRRHCC